MRRLLSRPEPSIVLAAALLFLPGPLRRDVWVSDEPRYAAIVEDMIATGQWTLPRLNGLLYADKPPLYFWLLAWLRNLWGSSPTWLLVLPAAASAAALLVVVERWGRRRFGPAAGRLSALVLATSGLFLGLGQAVRMDIPFALFVTAALLRLADRLEAGGGFDALAWVLLGLAVLTKGPAGLLVPLLVLVACAAARGQPRGLGRLGLARGIGLALAVVLPWLVAALLQGGRDYAGELLVRQSVGRAMAAWVHAEPPWFFLARLPLVFLPWTPFLLVALLDRGAGLAGPARAARRFLLVWAAVWLTFFSLVSGKLEVYLLAMFPALALVTGDLLARASAPDAPRGARRLLAAAGVTFGLGLIAVAALLAAGRFGTGRWLSTPAVPAVCLTAGLAAFAALAARRARLPALLPGATMAAVLWAVVAVEVPAVDRRLSGRELGARLAALDPPPVRIGSFGPARPELAWWLGGRVERLGSVEEVAAFLEREPRSIVLARSEAVERLRAGTGLALRREVELELGWERLVAVRAGAEH